MQVLWMVLAAFAFACMSVCVKYAAVHFSATELVFYRGLVGMVLLYGLARSQGVVLATRNGRMHAWRSVVGVVALGAWFFSIARLPLATALTLNYMSSLWIAAFLVGASLLQWRPSAATPRPVFHGPLLATVAGGFVGVVLLLQPSLGDGPEAALGALVGLLSGLCAALAYVQVVALSRMGEPDIRTVFYFAVGSVVTGLPAMLITGLSDWPGWPALWLLPVGALAAVGQLFLTRAFASAKNPRTTLVLANLQYSGIIFGALFGMLLFGEHIPLMGWVGMALIASCGILSTLLRDRATPASAPEKT